MVTFEFKSSRIGPSGAFARETYTWKASLRAVLMYKRDLYREILAAGEDPRRFVALYLLTAGNVP